MPLIPKRFSWLAPIYWEQSTWLLFAWMLSVVTQLAGILLLVLSGWFISAAAVAGLHIVTAKAFNFFTPGALVRGCSMGRSAGRYGERVVGHEATLRVLTRIRVWFFRQIQPRACKVLKRYRTADLLNRLVSDIDVLDHLYLRLALPVASALLVGSLVVFGALWWFPSSVMYSVIITLLFIIALLGVFYRLGSHAGQHITQQTSRLRVKLSDYIEGLKEFTLYGGQDYLRRGMEQEEAQLIQAQRRMAQLSGGSTALMTLCTGFAMAGILWWVSPQVLKGTLSGPILVAVLFLAFALLEVLAPLPTAFQFLGKVWHALQRVSEITETKPVVFGQTSADQPPLEGAVHWHNIRFAYEEVRVLDAFNLSIAAGAHMALLGATGCGKSTLIQLLCRNIEPEQGMIHVDTYPLDALSEAHLRHHIAVMPQQIHIFNGTLADNLRLVNAKANDEKVLDVLQSVGLDHLTHTEYGLDRWLGEGGVALSGGERKRLGIARILLSDARVIVLDEPTEGLDAIFEAKMMALIRAFCQGKTLLLITHRLIGLAAMDSVGLMDQGAILEKGSHKALMQQGGSYATIINKHLGKTPIAT